MRRFAQIMAGLGVLALLAVGGHELLVHMAAGDDGMSQWSASTCASCHSGGL